MSPVAIMLSHGVIDNDLFLGLSGSSTFLEALTVMDTVFILFVLHQG